MLKVLKKINYGWGKVGVFFRFEHFARICRYDAGNFRFIFEMAPMAITLKILFPVGDKSSYPKTQ